MNEVAIVAVTNPFLQSGRAHPSFLYTHTVFNIISDMIVMVWVTCDDKKHDIKPIGQGRKLLGIMDDCHTDNHRIILEFEGDLVFIDVHGS
jgi:hypothetical protein